MTGNSEVIQPVWPSRKSKTHSAGDGFGDALIRHRGAAVEEAAGGEEFGVEKGGAGGTANEVVGEQGEFYVEERAFTNAADDGGHAVASGDVATGLGAIFFVEDDNGIFQGGGERGQLGADFEIAQGFADFIERSDFFQADGDAFEVAIDDRNAIAMGAEPNASVNEPRTIPFAEQLLRLKLHFFFFTTDEGDDVALDIHRGHAGVSSAGNGLKSDDEDFLEAEGIGERFQYKDKAGGGAIGIGDDKTGAVAAILLLHGNGVEMGGVYFGNEQRDIRVHAVIA